MIPGTPNTVALGIGAALGLTLAVAILVLIRRDHLYIRQALWWVAVAAVALAVGVFPAGMDYVGRALGILYPPMLAAVIAIVAMLIKILLQDVAITRQERQIRRLAQELAMRAESPSSKDIS
ncbi:MAG: DUF2304 domain-containing protein [Betaproteobacteria bacterium]|nr:DUF2304 domain-containing protein [Betaproteobacteria bacterium]